MREQGSAPFQNISDRAGMGSKACLMITRSSEGTFRLTLPTWPFSGLPTICTMAARSPPARTSHVCHEGLRIHFGKISFSLLCEFPGNVRNGYITTPGRNCCSAPHTMFAGGTMSSR